MMKPTTATPGRAKSLHLLRSGRVLLMLLMAAGIQLAISSAAHAQQRVALLIGNSSYQTAPLSNPPNDVQAMEAALKATGFKVQKVLNANQGQMKRAVRDFGEAARGAELAFMYYSGHGTQIQGQNYLIPVGAEAGINKESDYEIEAVSINHIMGQIAAAQPSAAVVVLDSCRNNPFARSIKSAQKGMARIVSPQGILVAYATSPDNTADDNGYYAKALAGYITTPGLELVQVFRNTAKQVQKSSNGKQIPFIGDLSINDSVYLASIRPEPVPQAAPQAVAQPQPVQAARPAAPTAGQSIKDCAQCPELVVIPAGSFTMGSSAAEQALAIAGGLNKDQTARESPQHSVSVKSFAAGKYTVTKGEFANFVSAKSYVTEAEKGDGCYVWKDNKWQTDKASNWRNVGFKQGDDHPVVCVSWNDAKAYAQWVSQVSGKSYRLLTEAEREYAARAGSQSAYWWGDSISTGQANYDGNYSYNGSAKGEYRQATVAVSSFQANPFGLYNVHGNVWEWVEDCFHDTYSGAPTDGSAWTTGCSNNARVLRGGSWSGIPANLRSAFRGRYTPVIRYYSSGFRLARTAP